MTYVIPKTIRRGRSIVASMPQGSSTLLTVQSDRARRRWTGRRSKALRADRIVEFCIAEPRLIIGTSPGLLMARTGVTGAVCDRNSAKCHRLQRFMTIRRGIPTWILRNSYHRLVPYFFFGLRPSHRQSERTAEVALLARARAPGDKDALLPSS